MVAGGLVAVNPLPRHWSGLLPGAGALLNCQSSLLEPRLLGLLPTLTGLVAGRPLQAATLAFSGSQLAKAWRSPVPERSLQHYYY